MDRRKRQYSSHTRSLASSASHPRRRPRSSPYLAEDIENGIVVSLLPSLPQGGRTTVRDAVHDVSIRSSPSPQHLPVTATNRHRTSHSSPSCNATRSFGLGAVSHRIDGVRQIAGRIR
ncbi:uncharacterized protein RHTO_01325 [Rhodotorula toruloides NP11]|uniref:Uncharacterized protein n=1 Tax=Rhodotorula toruloides (strain NP11) TaxID=1130832 RepID=M7XNB2_RHOT1|nr:uncharacterized protein RHTO_01325 [Rhodotorula toruloides NP11]EMS21678.1 hypothetical protein RHTO_01325 [Rhodotorula toruloides NP11]